MLQNSGQPTRFNSFNGTFSAIDLSITSVQIGHAFTWNTHFDLWNSDHYPIHIQIPSALSKGQSYSRPQKWNVDKADWDTFRELCSIHYNDDPDADINTLVSNFNHHIIEAAKKSEPKTSNTTKLKHVPWWSDQRKTAIKLRNSALQKFRATNSQEDLELFRLRRAQARRLVRSHKKES